jgi:hypothetical protein
MQRLTVSFLFIVMLGACEPAVKPVATPLVLMNDSALQLKLSPAEAPVETPLQLTVLADNVAAVTGQISGVSMYMGSIPLQFSQHNGAWQATFLLGACSNPAMQWQVHLELEYIDGKKLAVKQQFHSSW